MSGFDAQSITPCGKEVDHQYHVDSESAHSGALDHSAAVLQQQESHASNDLPLQPQFANEGLERLNVAFEPPRAPLQLSGDGFDPYGNAQDPDAFVFPTALQQPLAQEPPPFQLTKLDVLPESKPVEQPLHLEVTPQQLQVSLLLRGSTILGHNSSLTDLAVYDHAWRILQENYSDVGALIGKRDAFSCAHDVASAFVDTAAKNCFLSGPTGCGKTDVMIATAFLLLLCGKVQTIVVCYDKHDQSLMMLNTMRMTCDAATAYIAAADLPVATKSIVINNIYALSNIRANTVFRCVPKIEAELWCSLPNLLFIWDAPLPVSPSLADKLTQASCVLVLSCLPLSLAQASGNTDLVPMSKQSLELKMESLSEKINEIMYSIKQQQQLQQLKAQASEETSDAIHSSVSQGTDIATLNLQMREKLAQLESQTLKAFFSSRAFFFTPFSGYRSLVSYHNRGKVHSSWAISSSHPSSTDAIHRILLQLQNASRTSHHCHIALFFLRHDCDLDSMKVLCASLGVECLMYPGSADSFSSSKLVVVLCALGGHELPHIVLPKPQIALLFLEPFLSTSQSHNSTSFNCSSDDMVLVQQLLCGFDSEFDQDDSHYPSVFLPGSLLAHTLATELTTDCITPQTYRSFFHPVCGSFTLKAGSDEAFAFLGNSIAQNRDPNAAAVFSALRRNFLCRRLLMLLLQNPNMISYHCSDGSVTIDEVQHKEICSRLELCMALMYDPCSTFGVATECEESERTMNQIMKAATENRHYPSERTFHISWCLRFQPQGDLLLWFALVGWTFDVSCETAVFIANCHSAIEVQQPSSQHESTSAACAASTIISIIDSTPPPLSANSQSPWAKHRHAAEMRNLAARQPVLEQEALMLSRSMTAFSNELFQRLSQEDSFHDGSVWKFIHSAIEQEIFRDHINMLLALRAPKGTAQRETVLQSLRSQIQLFILKSATTVAVHCEKDDAIALRSRLAELALPTKHYGSKQRNLLEDVSETEKSASGTTGSTHNIENVFAVDRILGQKIIDGLTKFRVRWEGYPPQEDTWEPADNIADIVLNEWKKKKRMSGTAEHCILDQAKQKGGNVVYRLRWKGFGAKNDTWEPEENIFEYAVKEWRQKLASLEKSKIEALSSSVPPSVIPQPVESDLIGSAISRSSSASSTTVRTASSALATTGDQRVRRAGAAPHNSDSTAGIPHMFSSSSERKIECAVLSEAGAIALPAKRRISAESAEVSNTMSRSSSASSTTVRTSRAASATGGQLPRLLMTCGVSHNSDSTAGIPHMLASSSERKIECAVLSEADATALQAQRRISAESAQAGRAVKSGDVFAVDSIVDQKMVHGVMKYRVRWNGFGPLEDTWEPADNISSDVIDEWISNSKDSTEASRSQIDVLSTSNVPSAASTKSSQSSHHESTKNGQQKKHEPPGATAVVPSSSMAMLADRIKLRHSSTAVGPTKAPSLLASSQSGSAESRIKNLHSKHRHAVHSKASSNNSLQVGSRSEHRHSQPSETSRFNAEATLSSSKSRRSGTSSKRKREELPSCSEVRQTKTKDSDIRVGKSPDIFYVDRVVDEKIENGSKTYRVRWVGYSANDDTWEPASHISARVIRPPHVSLFQTHFFWAPSYLFRSFMNGHKRLGTQDDFSSQHNFFGTCRDVKTLLDALKIKTFNIAFDFTHNL